jgi:predicted RNA-binding Zn-ribbon protein involved in translation (DUF1610 family)
LTNNPTGGIIKVQREKERFLIMMKDIRLEMTCPFCGATHTVDCREEQYNRYCNGELAQVAFDDLNATEREQIISHICPKCQSDIFGDDEDDYFDEE